MLDGVAERVLKHGEPLVFQLGDCSLTFFLLRTDPDDMDAKCDHFFYTF